MSTHDSSAARERGTDVRQIRATVLLLVLLVLGVLVAAITVFAGTAPNPTGSFPITVDGTSPTAPQSLGFASGSLYRDPKPGDKTNTSAYIVSNNVKDSLGTLLPDYWFAGIIESTKITADTYNLGEQVAEVDLTVTDSSNLPIPARLLVDKGATGFQYWVVLNLPGGPTTFQPSDVGMVMASSITATNSFAASALVTQFAIPTVPAAVPPLHQILYPLGTRNRIVVSYFTPGDQKLVQISDGFVSADATTTINNSDIVPSHVDMVIGNIGSVDPTKNGNVPVDLHGVPGEVLNDKNLLQHIVLRDTSLSVDPHTGKPLDFAGSFFTVGVKPTKMNTPKLNGDGTVDLKLFFPTSKLRDNGGFTIDSTRAELAGLAVQNNGSNPSIAFASKADVTVSLIP